MSLELFSQTVTFLQVDRSSRIGTGGDATTRAVTAVVNSGARIENHMAAEVTHESKLYKISDSIFFRKTS